MAAFDSAAFDTNAFSIDSWLFGAVAPSPPILSVILASGKRQRCFIKNVGRGL